MFKATLLSLFLLVLLICFPQVPTHKDKESYKEDYARAEKLFKKTDQLYSLPDYDEDEVTRLSKEARDLYIKAAHAAENDKNDSLALLAHYQAAVLWHDLDSLDLAKFHYLKSVDLKKSLVALSDTIIFKPLMFAGGIYYSQNQFDSALYYYKKAEKISDESPKPVADVQRLYNRLGAMYYETGDYYKAITYFEKAVDLLPANSPYFKQLSVYYKNNIASSLLKLEEYERAEQQYKELLETDQNSNEIFLNLGSIKLNEGEPIEAISWFKKVNYDDKKNILLYNKTGKAWLDAGNIDSAEKYFDLAVRENSKWNGEGKNIYHGLTCLYRGEKERESNNIEEAIRWYQKAIQQFSPDFSETDVDKNPVSYNGSFSYINLFNALSLKADAFESLYLQSLKIEDLETSLNTWRSAFQLASYVEDTYDSDESRLFLNKVKYTVHNKPISVCLNLYRRTEKIKYLEEAWIFDQENKASVLASNLRTNVLRDQAQPENELLQKLTRLKKEITRLTLKAQQLNDTAQLRTTNTDIRNLEIELGKLKEKIDPNTELAIKSGNNQIPAISQLREKLDNKTALLSYHLSDDEILILIATKNRFNYHTSPVNHNFFDGIEKLKLALHHQGSEQKYNGAIVAADLYQQLITPVIPVLDDIQRLIIIPDDELNYLPFEALINAKKEYLVENFSVQYQYTASLPKNRKKSGIPVSLSFAPFADKGYTTADGEDLSQLTGSRKEIANTVGDSLIGEKATKNQFFNSFGKYDIIHLATHASANSENPDLSYIAFSPETEQYKLYAGEIYNLQAGATKLVILSACETGSGKLVKGEGLMSLSRAFAYAGCPNIITSLWKAEDKTTAFLGRRLHHYLDEKVSFDQALQHAKIDLLKSKEIDPSFKTPDFWSHLVFIGEYEPDLHYSNTNVFLIVLLAVTSIYLLLWRKKKMSGTKA
ncbi:MAG TPA: CHAT domain-containing protein [Chitinophagaceae bacterium]|nr:CHAT domain-containing protein [Chitinophagales bacterium]HPG11957.1 CHAT domain-containing protein [Chitinophagaceae bacterium]